jgi:outer membrane protein
MQVIPLPSSNKKKHRKNKATLAWRVLFILGAFTFLNFASRAQNGSWTLRQCLETAWENNITMKQNLASVEGNKIAVNQAKMNRFPNLNASGSQSVNFGRSVNPFDNTVVENQQVNSNSMGLSTSINIFSGLQNTYTIQQRELNLKASKDDIQTTRNNITLGVVDAFANVLSCKALLSTANAQFESSKAQVERTQKLVAAGSLPITSLYDLKAQMATEETNIVVAENNLDLAKLSLSQWMQVDPNLLSDIAEPKIVIGEGEEKSSSEVYQVAESNQPQIIAARTRVLAAEKGISVAKSNYYPSLNFQAGLFTNYSSLASRFIPGKPLAEPILQPVTTLVAKDTFGNTLPVTVFQKVLNEPGRAEELSFANQFDNNLRKGFTFNLTIPIFNGFASRYAIENAKVAAWNSKLQLDQQKNQLRQSIQTAVANEKASRKRLAAVENQILALEEAFRSAENRLNLGAINPVDYLLAKNNLARAQNDKIRFKYDFFIRRALVDFYMGKELNFK